MSNYPVRFPFISHGFDKVKITPKFSSRYEGAGEKLIVAELTPVSSASAASIKTRRQWRQRERRMAPGDSPMYDAFMGVP